MKYQIYKKDTMGMQQIEEQHSRGTKRKKEEEQIRTKKNAIYETADAQKKKNFNLIVGA